MMQHLLNNTKSLSLGAYKHDTDCKYYVIILFKIFICVYRLYCTVLVKIKKNTHISHSLTCPRKRHAVVFSILRRISTKKTEQLKVSWLNFFMMKRVVRGFSALL